MRTEISLYLLLLSSSATDPRVSGAHQGIAAKWSQFSHKVITGGILSVTDNIGSSFQCLVMCLEMKACVSVFYRQVSRRCQFHDVFFLSPKDGEEEVGTEYYSITTGECPFGYINARSIGLCYQQHLSIKNRDDAVSDCGSRGEHLIVIDSEEKQDHVTKQVTASSEAMKYSYYIDGSDVQTEGQWVYHDGRPMTFFAWAEGYPKNESEFGNYVVTTKVGSPFLWQDKPRAWTRFYICEKDI